ncbi:uncharacterized protein TRIADDRAFT_22803 [Trichoplax adhaerens]|uniref:Aminopeptidase n=1 Tax=Trichoplax adhaerens TaxID=10228 RepID=B3RRX5_TRIAD|nr:hypothetical protein TRIADDRAFT_22803 [Trichoplax adhaerens]EDV26424.1 hypothetical protein TRIADDRAFT_22803 [Trichoplax adhaerens]|eukprot:XP_002110420.1 hypothetical protein TRIADDRAFT_22803 [Trichoplax adhaerens]
MANIKKLPFSRLPKAVIPVHYALEIKPNLKTFKFNGRVVVDTKVNEETDEILINSADIEILRASFNSVESESKRNLCSNITYHETDETVSIKYPQKLAKGDGKLMIDYVGILNDKMKGFYRSKFTAVDGSERYVAVTQFESTDARRALPCWDEPAIKATFDVTMIVPKDKVALSNMVTASFTDYRETENISDLKVIKFAKTPIMSTYLLAFVVGDFEYVEARSADGVLVRVYAPIGKKDQGKFALDVAVKTLPFYKDYFNIPYPLPKIDLIAIADFAAGAMENWGLVTYRETALLIDPVNSSSSNKQWVAIVVGHELAHQWFGNLVTMEWWTHLWLNEGFASWIEYLCVDHCFPEWDIWTQFLVMDSARALELDSLNNSHPIEVPVGHPSEVDEIFDAISYQKGSSIIAMLHDFLGDDGFRSGLNHYLEKFKYSNAQTEDLWESLEGATQKPVNKVMSSWTRQMGYPVVSVSAKHSGQSVELEISQSKFCADGQLDSSHENYEWLIPMVIANGSNNKQPVKIILDEKSKSVTLQDVKQDDWVKINFGQFGFYRVRYTSDMLLKLVPAVANKVLSPRDRLGLQNDTFALTKAGLLNTTDYLDLLQAFSKEDNYTVWSDIIGNFGSIISLMEYANLTDGFKAVGIELLTDIVKTLGWEMKANEKHTDGLLRSLAVLHLGRFGHTETMAEAKSKFAAHLDGTKAIDPDLRSAIYKVVLSEGDETTFNALLKLIDTTDLQEEKMRVMVSLGAANGEHLLTRALEFAMSDKVRSQDKVFIIESIARSGKIGRQLTWNFMKQNWDKLNSIYQGGFLLSRLIKGCLSGFAGEEFSADIREFFSTKSVPAAERTIEQVIESIELNTKWLSRDVSSVTSWMQNKNYIPSK